MIVVRDIFQLKFGKARDFRTVMENGKHLFDAAGINYRLLADLVGDSYTFVLETTASNLAEWESNMRDSMTDEWRRWYQTVTPLCESGKREIFTVVE